MTLAEKIDLNNLDKSNWKTYRFDEIAKNISERVDPNNTDLTVYIGLEHIDSESLHIKRTGTPDDVNGQKLRFYEGDIIFGRRRAYQRKAAIATCDGFCSAHALVLRANPYVIDPKLFPFFMHSDLFMHKAVDISVGSLSPTINWGTLRHQEFRLPPKDQQAKLAELFWAIDYGFSSGDTVLTKLIVLKNNIKKRLLSESNEVCELQAMFHIVWGNTKITKKSYVQSGFDAYSATGRDGFLSKYDHENDGIVLSAIGADCGKCFLAYGRWTAIKNTITIIPKVASNNLLSLVFEIINDKNVWPTSGGAQPFISQKDARKVLIPSLNESELNHICKSFDMLNSAISNVKTNQQRIKTLVLSLLNQVF